MDDKDIDKFDPTVAELTRMVEVTKGITATDLTDKAQLDIVHKNRIALKGARVKIEKKGKELREDAILFQKKVITKEKELIAIIEPEEDRLKAIEEEADALVIREEREERLPARILRLRDIGDGVEVADDFLLTLDGTAFEAYFNERVAAKNEAGLLKAEADQRAKDEESRVALAAKEKELADAQAKIDADKRKRANEAEASRLSAEKDAREREDKAREEERAKAAEDARRAETERVEREKRKAEEATADAVWLAKREEYRKENIKRCLLLSDAFHTRSILYSSIVMPLGLTVIGIFLFIAAIVSQKLSWRAECGWTEATKNDFYEKVDTVDVVLYKKVGTFKL